MAQDVFRLVGTVIDGRYRIDSVIGEGGFGVVYRGHHQAFDQAIAVKCLKIPSHFSDQGRETFLKKFQEEGKILSRLGHHPAIVRVFDLGLTKARGDDVPYLVLEWLDGFPLADLLQARRARTSVAPESAGFGEAEAVAILRPVIEALASVHAEGIAHRDVKPENIFIMDGAKGSPAKLLDFGIAKAMQEGERITQVGGRTSSNFAAFSPQHGAPEQFRPAVFGATGPWTDVHALGLILGELTSNRAAMPGLDFAELLVGATMGTRPTPRALGANVSDAFERVIVRALAFDPRERFADASAFLAALDEVVPRVPRPALERPVKPEVAGPPTAEAQGFVIAPSARGASSPSGSASASPSASAPAGSTELNASRTAAAPAIPPLRAEPSRRRSSALPLVVGTGAVALAAGVAIAWVVLRAPSKPSDGETAQSAAATATATATVVETADASASAVSSEDPIESVSASDDALATVTLSAITAKPPSGCAPGQVNHGGLCCWAGQQAQRGRCIGTPRCPPGYDPRGEACVPKGQPTTTPTVVPTTVPTNVPTTRPTGTPTTRPTGTPTTRPTGTPTTRPTGTPTTRPTARPR